jgi:hypothetical protein
VLQKAGWALPKPFLYLQYFFSTIKKIPTAVNFGSLDRSRYFSIQVAPQLSSRGWVDPVPDSLLLRKSGSAANRTWDLWICSQELWPLDHRDFNILKFCILPTEYITVFRIVLTVNNDCFPKQHQPADLCCGDVMCFLWGKNWIFIHYLEQIQCSKC